MERQQWWDWHHGQKVSVKQPFLCPGNPRQGGGGHNSNIL
jgi:hypothetical protein